MRLVRLLSDILLAGAGQMAHSRALGISTRLRRARPGVRHRAEIRSPNVVDLPRSSSASGSTPGNGWWRIRT